tara:strand:+ start:6196 stop:6300 length:105 start_codon:yes stop_codon:yes gene_type:complete
MKAITPKNAEEIREEKALKRFVSVQSLLWFVVFI